MSESRSSSESRMSSYVPVTSYDSSESRECSESREEVYIPMMSYSPSESRESSESRNIAPVTPTISQRNSQVRRGRNTNNVEEDMPMSESLREKYNALKDIDQLIEGLEGKEVAPIYRNNPVYDKAMRKRKTKIEELKKLRDEAKKKFEEEKILEQFEKADREIDSAIDSVRRLIKKPDYNVGESRDSSESRW